ncbi:unnamed protein product [Hymenolepis diminuta]|uniref:Uncharacterized protein n=1 Tax=Hymenolepis diminuta TaxID=6216 RepID=A0A564XWV0_HYMDI|nr:unnamed protein product [Hymenolepis diminuta]
MEAIPSVPLAIRTGVKDDLNYLAVEMVFGVPWKSLATFYPLPTILFGQALLIFTSTDLKTCSHIFPCHEAVREPLQPTYDASFSVLQEVEKAFTLLQNGKESVVFMDHVKPAYPGKPITESATSVFHPKPLVKKAEKLRPFTRRGNSHCREQSEINLLLRFCVIGGVLESGNRDHLNYFFVQVIINSQYFCSNELLFLYTA